MRLTGLLLALVLLGCSGVLDVLDQAPARVEVSAPRAAVLDGSLHSLSVRVLTKGGKSLPEAVSTLAWSATPAGIVDVNAQGLRCVGSGDAAVLVTGGGVSTTFSVACRLVAQVQMPEPLLLLVGEPDAAVAVSALDGNGRAFPDVEPELRSSAPGVFVVQNGAAHAVSVGSAQLLAEAGAARGETAVTVIERVATESLAIGDGGSTTYTLTRGKYLVEIHVRDTDGGGYGVSVSGVGAGCPSRGEATDHKFTCEVPGTSSLVIANPTTWGMGPSETGNLTIYRSP